MNYRDYKYSSKDFFYIRRFPLYLSIPLFLGMQIILVPIALFILIIFNRMFSERALNLLTSGQMPISIYAIPIIILLGVIAIEFLLIYLFFITKQAVGVQGIYNIRKGLLPWSEIFRIHLGIELFLVNQKQQPNSKLAKVFLLVVNIISIIVFKSPDGIGSKTGSYMLSSWTLENQLVFSTRVQQISELRNEPRKIFDNRAFKLDLSIIGKNELLLSRMSKYLSHHPDWERIQSKFL